MNKLAIKEKTNKWLWSSTEYSSANAWNQLFYYGIQDYYYKTYSYWARAVRRVKK